MLKRIPSVVLIFALIGLVVCLALIAYNPSADQEIVRSGVVFREGPPKEGESCSYPDIPEIIVWGDGLAYYRAVITPPIGQSRWSRLSRVEMLGVTGELWLHGLFTDFKVGGPNPAGDSHELSVHTLLFSHQRDLLSDISPVSGTSRAYEWLVGYLSSRLAVFEPGTSGEARIDRLNIDRECSVKQPTP